MKLRRAIAALGAVFALSFGLMLAPSQANAATLTINPRANAVEAGQVLAAPDGSVFTITVYDAGLTEGQKAVTHTYVTGNTLRQTANKIVQAINADTDLQAIGVTATLGTGANYTINSTSTNGTLYKQSTTGGGTNRLAIQQTLTIGGTVTVDDKLTLTIYDAGLVGGKEAVVYKPNTGDTLANIVIRLRNKINNSATLSALDISAKVSATDPNTLLIESPTFDTTENFTSYSAVVKAGGTETMTLGAFWGTNGAQKIAISGPITVGETVEFAVYNVDLPDSHKVVSYQVQSGDSLNQIACGLRTELNNDSDLATIGTHARCAAAAGGPGMLEITSQSTEALTIWKKYINCIPVDTQSVHWPPNSRVKVCGSASLSNGVIARSALEALGNSTVFPGGGAAEDASQKLSSNFTRTWFVFANHDEYYESAHIPFYRENGGPNPLELQIIHRPVDPNLALLPLITGYTYGFGDFTYSVIFVSSKDVAFGVPTGIQNDYIDHATVHETGHHIDQWSGAKLSESAEFQTAWQRDMALMPQQPVCSYDAPVANSTSTEHKDGVFSAAVDYKGDLICSGPAGTGPAIHGGNSVAVMHAAYRYFGQSNLPLTEVFPELFSYQAGFQDTYNSGNNISGSHNIGTSKALECTRLFVRTWARHGRNPDAGELSRSLS